jgi:hypothetical protein
MTSLQLPPSLTKVRPGAEPTEKLVAVRPVAEPAEELEAQLQANRERIQVKVFL